MGAYLPLAILALLLIWAAVNYNLLVRIRQQVRESWSGIDTELKRRYDLIPNLVEAVRGYASHEREVLEAVTESRARAKDTQGTPGEQAREENRLVGSMRQLLAVVENYPDLKASDHFLSLQQELGTTEDRIQAARRFYNANVRDLNTRIEVFPSNLIASLFNFRPEEYFEVEEAVMREVKPVSFEE